MEKGKKKNRKDSYIMMRVSRYFKDRAILAYGKGKLSKSIVSLVENDDKFKEAISK